MAAEQEPDEAGASPPEASTPDTAPDTATAEVEPRPEGEAAGRSAPGGDRAPAGDRRGGGGRGRGRYAPRRRACQFCVDKVEDIDYKDAPRLRRYVSERGKIEPRRKTSTCARHQRKLTEALKRARHLALLPYSAEHVRATGFFPPRG
jgi:small subunit ribosomal protein S18